MALDKILEKIAGDAAAEVEAILEQGRQKAQARQSEIMNEAQEKVALINQTAEADAAEEHRRARLIAELDGRKQDLAAKRQVIDEAYEKAMEALQQLDDATWSKLITQLVLDSAETGSERLRVPEKDAARMAALLPDLNAKLIVQGKKGELTLDAQYAAFSAGVVLVSEISEINASFEAVLRQARQQSEKEVADILFATEVK